MSWTATDHEGTKMWEQDGERVKEVPEERSDLVIEHIRYSPGVSPMWIPSMLMLGYLAGMLMAAALELKL